VIRGELEIFKKEVVSAQKNKIFDPRREKV